MFSKSNRMEKHVPDLLESIMRPTLCVKDRVTADFVQNESIWVQNLNNQNVDFLDSGNLMDSCRRPTQPSRPESVKQYLGALASWRWQPNIRKEHVKVLF